MRKKYSITVITGVILGVCISGVVPVMAQEGKTHFVYDAHKKRDPFMPVMYEDGTLAANLQGVQSLDELRLEGIAWDPDGHSLALLNGTPVREGQTVSGVTVRHISENSVTVEMDGEEFQLHVGGEEQ